MKSTLRMLFNKRFKEIPDRACFSIKDPMESILRMLFDQSTREIHPCMLATLPCQMDPVKLLCVYVAFCLYCFPLLLRFSLPPPHAAWA